MTATTSPVPEPAGDAQYRRMQRHLSRRAIGVSLVSVAVVVTAVVSAPGRAPGLRHPGWVPLPSPQAGDPVEVCTAADLAKPVLTVMPAPRAVGRALVIHPSPDLEQLSPPDSSPTVSAQQAWEVMRREAPVAPTTAGSTQVLLGDLYATTPAVRTAGRQARPVFSHRLVWAIYDSHQPARLESRGAAASQAACYFESAVFYVDALTGRPLVAEVYPPVSDPSTAV